MHYVGSVLSQLDDADGNDHPVAYLSHKLLPLQDNIPCISTRMAIYNYDINHCLE